MDFREDKCNWRKTLWGRGLLEAHTLWTHTYTQDGNNGFYETKLGRENRCRKMPVRPHSHSNKKRTATTKRWALTLPVTVRGLDQDLLPGPPTQRTHTRSGKEAGGGEKAEGHVGGERGTRQHLQSPLLIALLPAWSQITGLEMLQSGLYLLASLPAPQIRTSKPPSYHLLVNLQRRKGHRDTVKSDSFAFVFLCLRLFLPVCRERSWRFGTPTTEFTRRLETLRAMFSPPSSLWVEALMWGE